MEGIWLPVYQMKRIFHLLRRNTRFISRRNRKTPAPQGDGDGRRGSAAGFAPVANKRQVVAFHFLYQGLIAELTLHPAPRRLAKDGAPDGETFDHRVCGRLGETGAQFVGRRVKPEDQDPAAPLIFTLDKRGDLLPAGAGERRQLPPVRFDPQLIKSVPA